MPDESGNYLHLQLYNDIESIMIIRDLLLDQEFYPQDVSIKEDEKYFRIWLNLKDVNGDSYSFHSRKLNLIDVVYERDMILQ